ncbi:MAG: hypothetical protein JWN61_2589 [Pseudonocardiales bacterium]|nr:hypothetical protein [Pseudonocardiales bacterium]
MNVVFRTLVSGRGELRWEMPDQAFIPRVGDQIVLLTEVTPTVIAVAITLQRPSGGVGPLNIGSAVVTLADPGAVSDGQWFSILENLGLPTPTTPIMEVQHPLPIATPKPTKRLTASDELSQQPAQHLLGWS